MNANFGIKTGKYMKKILLLIFVICYVFCANGQVAESLVSLGFENVRSADGSSATYISWEDNRYRSSYTGISVALRAILNSTDVNKNHEFIVTKNGIPQLHLAANAEDIALYKKGEIDFADFTDRLIIDYETDKAWSKLSNVPLKNRASWKADFVIYPQLSLDNSTFDVLYEYCVSLAPALEMQMWKGAKLTLQAQIPVFENMNDKRIKPGFITLSQEFDMKNRLKLKVTAGNFNANRAGGIVDLKWHSKNSKLELGARAAASVQSFVHPVNGWKFSKKVRFSGSAYADYFIPRLNTELKAQLVRYVYGYNGVRTDLTRHFGEYSIGLYALYVKCDEADNGFNGGFNFSIPLPGKRYAKNKGVRVRQARDWGPEYYIKSIWNDDHLKDVTKSINASADEGDAGLYMQPDYIRHFMKIEYQKGKQQ